jgi:cell division protein FtsW
VARKLKSDKVLFIATLLLVCASIVMVWSASAVVAMERYDQPYYFLTKQVMWTALGLAVLVVSMRVDYRLYKHDAVVWGLLALVGILLVAVFFSPAVNGSRRWLGYGGLGIQPSELAKVAAVLFTALVLERRMHRINDLSYSLPPIAIITGAISVLIFFQPDYGTMLSLVLIVAAMVFAAGLHYKYIVGVAILAVPLLGFMLLSADYRRDRILAFLDPWADPLDKGFQTIQSLIAVGTGGITGKGVMGGVQKLFYLPEPHTDFIFAVIGEELGLIGTTAVLLCFCVIAWRGLRISMRAEDRFGSLVAFGLTTMICVQAFVNMSMVLALLPTKGIPLPFVSNGGSSLLVSLLATGLLLNISQHESTSA